MADSILTDAQMRAAFDNMAKAVQKVAAGTGHAFASGVNEGTDSLVYGLRALAETDMRAWTSDDAIAKAQAAAHNALDYIYPGAGNMDGLIRLMAPIYGPTIRGLMRHWGSYQPQTTGYENFWATLNTLWVAAGSVAADKCILGEVALMMRYLGISVDPDYCVPPENMKIGHIEGTGDAAATLTDYNDIDPLIFAGLYTAEIYVIARNAVPAEITLSIANCKDEDDGPQDDGATTFTATIGAGEGAGDTIDLAQAASHILQSVDGATITFTGGQADDDFWIRVKQFRAAAY